MSGATNFCVRAIGFFNDAYDLFVMSIVNVILEEQYPNAYTSGMKSAVSTGVFVGSVLGQLVFGYYADQLGRRRIMIATAALLIVGGFLCTFAYGGSATNTLWMLALSRALLGFGIGGEYPLSCTATAEASSTKNRGQAVSATFSMQGVGQLAAALFGNLLVQCLANSQTGEYDDTNLEIIWRLLFGLGTVPALFILYPRFKAEESHHFTKKQDTTIEAGSTVPSISTVHDQPTLDFHKICPTLGSRLHFICKNYGKRLIGTAGTWFLFDIVFYAQSIFAATVFQSLKMGDASLQMVTLKSVFLAMGALPGYFVAIYAIDKIGRRNMQLQGFFFMTIIFTVLGIFWDTIKHSGAWFLILYALTFFFSNFGPNTTTFLLPVEAFPTPLRATCHGFSAAMGKVGAIVGSSMFVPLMESLGTGPVFLICAAICAISLPITWIFVQDRTGDLSLLDDELDVFLNQQHLTNNNSSDKYNPVTTPF